LEQTLHNNPVMRRIPDVETLWRQLFDHEGVDASGSQFSLALPTTV
jgi:hypothetical protein